MQAKWQMKTVNCYMHSMGSYQTRLPAPPNLVLLLHYYTILVISEHKLWYLASQKQDTQCRSRSDTTKYRALHVIHNYDNRPESSRVVLRIAYVMDLRTITQTRNKNRPVLVEPAGYACTSCWHYICVLHTECWKCGFMKDF